MIGIMVVDGTMMIGGEADGMTIGEVVVGMMTGAEEDGATTGAEAGAAAGAAAVAGAARVAEAATGAAAVVDVDFGSCESRDAAAGSGGARRLQQPRRMRTLRRRGSRVSRQRGRSSSCGGGRVLASARR